MDIKPLVSITSAKGGRPTRWRESLPAEIQTALLEGMASNNIIDALGSSWKELQRFAKKSKDMEKAYVALCGGTALDEKQAMESIAATLGEDDDYDTQLEHGEIEAVRTLRLILRTATSDSAKVQAAKELLDRKRGKPVQTTHVEQNTTYTIIAAIPAAPNSLCVAHDIEGECETLSE